MLINSGTKLMARINKQANNRAIKAYNEYFSRSNTNAICLELHNEKLTTLLSGLKLLNFAGAITVAFQSDPEIFELLDDVDSFAERLGSIGFITQRNGRYKGYSQGGYGLLSALTEKINLNNKKIVILGAGNVAKGLLIKLEENNVIPESIEIYNRSLNNAENLASTFKLVKHTGSLKDLANAEADLFINTTDIGAPWRKGEDYIFTEELLKKFNIVADINFVPLKTQLISLAEKLNKQTVPGWVTFKYGTEMCFRTILDIEVNKEILAEELQKDFSINFS